MVPINGITHRPAGGRLIVMSNRAPIRIVRAGGREHVEPTVGGVGTTFLRLLERSGGLWIAWAGGRNTPEPYLLPPQKPPVKIRFARLHHQNVHDYYYTKCKPCPWAPWPFIRPKCHF